jgi:uncharacterized membrane protein SpoIIM required for sporulation
MDAPPAPVIDPWLVGGSVPPAPIQTFTPTAPSLDPAIRAAFVPPPRPDRSPGSVREYVRSSPLRVAGAFFGLMVAGVLIGYGTGPHDAFAAVGTFRSGPDLPFSVAGTFWHNLLVVGIPLMLFPLLFWAPAATSAVTGFTVGQLAAGWLALRLPTGLLAAALLPHGVVEIPALLLGGTMVWRLGRAAWSRDRFGGTWGERAATALRAAIPFLAAVAAALLVAAYIEVKITPVVVARLAGF